MTDAPTEYVSINEAAAILGSKPWDVVRLINDRRVDSIQLVDTSSLRRFAGGSK